ncbi:four-carbon acid sugar kinase family protein [Telmatospirillum siberiense]|uniref:Four-carbon acid sugar kinase family protein n=1 Tax=Telmatospirillum siberiense TaxID=382514 RepID=A0A2N3PWM0_9PROT|nr:four-carbon acid sugar kinase family protein [Telmatospirillum siberiense]PKU24812.1 hypothetical protein CWS72_09495 [Telmatospirillum siberiense]
MPSHWLILADDLTGAADCAIAFAKRGLDAIVAWGPGAKPCATVLSIDVDSRRFGEGEAAERQVAALADHWRPGMHLYKKIDSTLRGQPFAELAAQLAVLPVSDDRRPPLVVLAPAFPAAGRVSVGGRVMVGDTPLEKTPLWARDHSYPSAHLPAILAGAGLTADVVALDVVRSGAERVRDCMRAADQRGVAAVVCDCSEDRDLAVVAVAALGLSRELVWVGSAGLAGALAAIEKPVAAPHPPLPPRHGGVLMVIGSLAEASRAQSALLVAEQRVVHVPVAPETLFAGPGHASWEAAVEKLSWGLLAGRDVLLEIALAESPDLAKGADLVGRLAEMVGPLAPSIGALVATGGDTACAVLSRMGVQGIRLLDDVEPGVPLGMTLSEYSIPVVTKAGGFGEAMTLRRCLDRLKS